MPLEKNIQAGFERIATDLPGYIAAALVDLESGLTLGMKSMRSDFDLAAASAYNSEMVKQKHKIMRALSLNMALEDMLITLADQIHLIKMVTPSTFLYLAADRANSNMAIVRVAVGKHLSLFV